MSGQSTESGAIVAGMIRGDWGACAICGAPRRPGPEGGDDLICGNYPEHYAVLGVPPSDAAYADRPGYRAEWKP